ncbi:ankyrin repeat protein, partial [Teladorsagia circumcincta]
VVESGPLCRLDRFSRKSCEGDTAEVERSISGQRVKLCHPLTGCSTLHLAVLGNNPTMLEILLRNHKVDVNMRDNQGRTALHYAAATCSLGGDPTMYYMLTERGAVDDIADYEGFTPIDMRQNPSLIDLERARYLNK